MTGIAAEAEIQPLCLFFGDDLPSGIGLAGPFFLCPVSSATKQA
jgi:hypothetical protein